MNILFVLPYCYVPGVSAGPSTGFGIYTVQLAEELAKRNDIKIYVLSMKQRFLQNKTVNEVTYLGVSDLRIIRNTFKKSAIRNTKSIYKYNYYNQNKVKKIATATYSSAKSELLDEIVSMYSIDVIHIHSIAQELYGIFHNPILANNNTLVTIHSDFVDEEKYGNYRDYFRNTVKMLFQKQIPMSFVSTGVMRNFIKEMGYSHKNLFITYNGTPIEAKGNSKKKRTDTFSFVCIGTIGKRKNQMAILEALKLIPEHIASMIHIDFLGMDSTGGEFDKAIEELGFSKICNNCGFVEPDKVTEFLRTANGNLMVSKNEPFGLSVIEGFQYGIPSLIYSDMAAVNDFYSEDAVMLLNDRSAETLAKGMTDFISHQWDSSKIKKWGEKFQLSQVAEKYINLYNDVKVKNK